MAGPDLNLVLHLALPDAGRLRREVCDLPVANVGPVVATRAPIGAKASRGA